MGPALTAACAAAVLAALGIVIAALEYRARRVPPPPDPLAGVPGVSRLLDAVADAASAGARARSLAARVAELEAQVAGLTAQLVRAELAAAQAREEFTRQIVEAQIRMSAASPGGGPR